MSKPNKTVTDVLVIDGDDDSRAWLLERFTAMAGQMVTTWGIAQDIAANWTEGRKVSELPECQGKYPGEVFRDWLTNAGVGQLDKPSMSLLTAQLKAARIKRLAPERYQALAWSLYGELPADADAEDVADIFARAEAQPIGVSKRGLRLVQGTATGMKQPYWQQVVQDLMEGNHGLTIHDATNIAATAQQWLDEQAGS